MVEINLKELSRLRRIERAARAFIDTVPESLRFRQAQGHFDELVNASLDTNPLDGKEWRCFFCDEVFKTPVDARNHFGITEDAQPACLIKAPGEFALLNALRNVEEQLARYRAEDSDILRAMQALIADHLAALRREEERGYARGVHDMQQELRDARHCVGLLVHMAGGEVVMHAPELEKFNPASAIESLTDPATLNRIIRLIPPPVK